MDAIRAGEPVGGGTGILPMVQAQRDRFKQKNAELEEELSKTYAIVKSLRQEIASLQKDNLNLYEKTRYVNTYGSQRGASQAAFRGKMSPMGVADSTINIDPEDSRYSVAYEAQISPFAAFRDRESARAYKRMSLPERAVYNITSVVLATRTRRNLFAAYCFMLHFILFIMMYKVGVLSGVVHDSTLGGASSSSSGAGAPAGGVDLGQMQQDRGQTQNQNIGGSAWHPDEFDHLG
ncbi:hypothetical protein KEM55_004744 [Ascosphaera atra]|nr:hypothetical protein KEM55_004744 [Ascosphaera atra]